MLIRVVFAWGRIGPDPQRNWWERRRLYGWKELSRQSQRAGSPLEGVRADRLGGELGHGNMRVDTWWVGSMCLRLDDT